MPIWIGHGDKTNYDKSVKCAQCKKQIICPALLIEFPKVPFRMVLRDLESCSGFVPIILDQ